MKGPTDQPMIFDNALFSNGGKGPLGEPVSIQGWKRQPQIKISKDGKIRKIMTNNQKIKKLIVIPLLIFTFLIQGTPAYARDGGGSRGGGGGSRGGGGGFRGGDFHGGGGGYHGGWGGPRWGWGGWGWALPLAATAMIIAGATYYYSEGTYYQRYGEGYVVVSEPVAPVVYQAVPQPIVVQTAPVAPVVYQALPVAPVSQNAVIENTTQGTSAINVQDSFVVNIPNSKGRYTPVTLKRSGNGFVGPQGEYYAEFPRIEQLKVMYAK